MTLSRRDLEEDRMRAIYMATVDAHRALSDEARAASLAATLAKKPAGSGWWVFAYGSLLWNPLFPFADAKPGLLSGLHRQDRKSTRLNSSHLRISYAVFCLKK